MRKTFFAAGISFCMNCFGQMIVKDFSAQVLTQNSISLLQEQYGSNKIIPPEYKKQILIALSFFPELKNVQIEFRVKQTCKAPLTTAPSIKSILLSPSRRKYIITIRNLQSKTLELILFENLPYNAQIGVIGHELSHVVDFNNQSSSQLIAMGIKHVSYQYVDQFEYKTDSICIAHGLGYQLLEWSKYVRMSLHRTNWIGAGSIEEEHATKRERYMNPSTILKRIKVEVVYLNDGDIIE
jgi:hypothetical protein